MILIISPKRMIDLVDDFDHSIGIGYEDEDSALTNDYILLYLLYNTACKFEFNWMSERLDTIDTCCKLL